MYRVRLTADELAELDDRCRDKATLPRTRDRREMVRLANIGWSIPRIARHFGRTESRVRHWLKAFLRRTCCTIAIVAASMPVATSRQS